MTDFKGLGLIEPILRAVEKEGYTTPSPIQAKSIPALLEGRDVLGVAQTGTGKTAAFVLPIIQRMHEANVLPSRKTPRALILAPTRELAIQIGESVRVYARHLNIKCTVVFGGAPIHRQAKALGDGVQVLVATPGRLMDLMNQDKVRLHQVDTFVLDEADRMLDMGFINDVRKIAAELPKKRHVVLFSATMPPAISKLAESLMDKPVRVEVAPQATTAERISQTLLHVAKAKKRSLLAYVLKDEAIKRVLIFTRTKHGADRVTRQLEQDGVRAGAIHGNKSQNIRQRTLQDFKSGRIRALVATDIAARGIDVDGVTHVINYELPNEADNYVHRIGRTARGGDSGKAIAFCDPEERDYLRNIQKTIRQDIEVTTDHPYHAEAVSLPDLPSSKQGGGGGRGRNGGGGGRPQGKKPSGKRFGDKGHGGHGHGDGGNHGAKSNSSKKSGAKKHRAPNKGGPNRAGGHTPMKSSRRGGNAI